MDKPDLKKRALACAPAEWPEIERAIDDFYRGGSSIASYAERACIAVGGQAEQSWNVCAALFCAVFSIRLVDDIIDEDPNGKYREIGIGRAANLAFAFEALGLRILATDAVAAGDPCLVQAYSLALLDTCHGQELDACGVNDEAAYWRQVEAKTPPLFMRALEMGARVGGADKATVDKLSTLGFLLGKLVQVGDDLSDAMQRPAKEDWKRPNSNLALLFASTASHAARDEFISLSSQVSDESALEDAQTILVRSGAVSYCCLKMFEFAQEVDEILNELELPQPAPLLEGVDRCVRPLRDMFQTCGHLNALGKLARPYVQTS